MRKYLSCHWDFTWNQFWLFYSPKKLPFLTILAVLNFQFLLVLTFSSVKFFQNAIFRAYFWPSEINHILISRNIWVSDTTQCRNLRKYLSCHWDFTWNQFWLFYSPKKLPFLTILAVLNFQFLLVLTFSSVKFFQNAIFRAYFWPSEINHILISRNIWVSDTTQCGNLRKFLPYHWDFTWNQL